MKTKITILMLSLFSIFTNAQNNYESNWKTVKKHEKSGKPKSALAEVETIYNLAKQNNNGSQIIKCFLFKSKYALTLEEDAQLKIISDIKDEINTAISPEKNMLESILANLYWQYFQQNRWKFYNRTNTAEKVDTVDFRTWDLQTIFNEIHLHHQKALESAITLQNTDLSDFDAILHTQKNSKKYRPTVYDFIAQNALEFYKTGESNLAQPSYKFEINDADFLGDNNTFINASFDSKDETSQKLNALKIYKNLTSFHLKDKDKTALVDITLNRMEFVKANARFNDVDTKYFELLKTLQTNFRKHEISTEIDYKLAEYYRNLGNTYTPNQKEEHQFKFRNAIELCEIAKANFPNSNGSKKCENLKNNILSIDYSLTNEEVVETDKESRMLLKYKNIKKLYFRIYKTQENQETLMQSVYEKKEIFQIIKKQKLQNSFEKIVKNESDFQNHKTEIVLPKLAQGFYIIMASDDVNFKSNDSFTYSFLQVSNLAITETHFKNEYIYQIVNRTTGKPLQKARVHFENFNTNNYNKKINKTLISDKKGFVTLQPNNYHNQVKIRVSYKDDLAVFKYFHFNKNRNRHNRKHEKNAIFLFSDRSIYRPTQTVYFKGIVIAQKENKSTVISDALIKVTLKDVNGQTVKTLELNTNEFGSFSGEFILPNSGLTGTYTINAENIPSFKDKLPIVGNGRFYGYHSISVEEYKRPKFTATFNPVKETFKINDSISVKGIATAYAGSNITDAKVVYRVQRKVQYPKWWYWYRPYGVSSESQEISHGETITNAKGEFKIQFLAQPDLSVKKEDNPVFTYEITADITDVNGETRSTSTMVKVGYHAITINIGIDSRLNKDSETNTIRLMTYNLNGEFVATKGNLKVYKTNAAKAVQRNRPWQIPEYQEIPKERFEQLFPHDSYQTRDKNDLGTLVFETDFDTNKSKEILLKKLKKWISGEYLIIATAKDKFKQKVSDRASFELFVEDAKKVSDNQLFTFNLDKAGYEPNDIVHLKIGTASKDLTVVVRVEKEQQIVSTKVIHLNNEIKTINIPVTNKDFGSFTIHYNLVNYNAYKQGAVSVNVPYPKTNLNIETLTFRDKLQPGQEETWSFKIKGSKSEKVVAEILTSMYDSSLDQFKPHYWLFNPIYSKYNYPILRMNSNGFNTENSRTYTPHVVQVSVNHQDYDQLDWFGLYFGNQNYGRRLRRNLKSSRRMESKIVSPVVYESGEEMELENVADSMNKEYAGNIGGITEVDAIGDLLPLGELPNETNKETNFDNVKARTNFNETAFFFPHLTTDKEGNVSFSFTIPESLTKWKLQLLAHTTDLQASVKTLETVTQKELMVLPNPPRFLRQGDQIVFSSKIANLTDKNLNGFAELQLVDAITNKAIDIDLGNTNKTQSFTVDAKGNTNISWKLTIPDNVQTVQYKIVAKAGDYSDGEQNVLPVLTNRMLVTETLPMWIRSNQTKTFTLDKLKNTESASRKNHKLTLEVTSNPAWYAVQALPYLMEYPYQCAEQTFSRYYANSLASHIANSNPKIQTVFKQWKNSDALLSNLEKNQELKSLIIQETPWLRDAQSETEQKKRIALLFDLHKMKDEQTRALKKLKQMQMPSGGFPWFKGSRYPNRYITQHIVSGLGHLRKLNVNPTEKGKDDEELLTKKAIQYLDSQILKDYKDLLDRARRIYADDKDKAQKIENYLKQNHTSHFQVQYLYARSFYKNITIPKKVNVAVDYYTNQSYKYWLDYNLYAKGLIALVAQRNDNNAVAERVLESLKETSITSEELGMYWKSNKSSYYWYQAPIETQALMVEVFSEVDNKIIQREVKNLKEIDNLKIWLLKNKQTNRWKTTKATTEAVYALLLQGTDWLENTQFVDITIGNETIKPLELENAKVEAGTGYYKTSWNTSEITSEMATVTIKKEDKGIAWGALYWQYFEDLDKITFAETPLKLKKKLFLKTNEDRGEKITEITKDTKLQLGDLVRVRIELKVDRDMEFIHMKDMRASGFEPVNVISQYKWQDGLGYYESTKDASTNFFIDRLPKGVYVFEYDLRVNNKGDFSNGITTIQSMYAPEFTSHSEGIRVKID